MKTIDPTTWTFEECHAFLVAHGHENDHGTAYEATDDQHLYGVRNLVRAVAAETLDAIAAGQYDLRSPDDLACLRTSTSPSGWVIVRSKFHGGGIVSHHRSVVAGYKALVRYCAGGCTCGCARLIPADAYDTLPTVEQAWGASSLARRA